MSQEVIKDFKLYIRLLGYIRPYWRIALISILAMVVSAALEPVLPALMQPLIDKSLIQRDGISLWQVPVLIVSTFILKGVADYIANVASQTIAQKTIADLRALIFSHQLDLPIARHRAEDGGRMLSRVTYDTSMVGEAVSTAWLTIIRDTLVLVGLLGFLFYTAWQLTLLVLLIAPALAFAIRRINGRLRQSSERVQGWMGRVTGLVEEALLGLQDIKIFGAYSGQADRFDQVNQGLRREQMRVVRVQAINVPLVQVLAACSVALVIYVASSLSRQDLLSPGEFIAFVTAMSMIFEPVRRLTNVNATLQRGLAAADSVLNLLDEKGEFRPITNQKRPKGGQQDPQPTPKEISTKAVVFEDVHFRYESDRAWTFSGISLSIEEGETVKLTGPSGSGKSTLVGLICGLEKAECGKILICGQSTETITSEEHRRLISLVGQHIALFDLSVAENIALGKPTASLNEIEVAARMACATEFIESLPEGFHTKLGPRGATLSGGQRQRIALARAFLKDAPILIFDEGTSALDKRTADQVFRALKLISKGKTTIVISHSNISAIKVDRTLSILDLTKPTE